MDFKMIAEELFYQADIKAIAAALEEAYIEAGVELARDFEADAKELEIKLAAAENSAREMRKENKRLEHTIKFQEERYLAAHGGSWGICKYKAELDALKAGKRQNDK